MRITAVETLEPPEHPLLLWVRIHTDEGVVGLGETVAQPGAAAAAVHGELADLLIGEDPLRIELLWHRCFRALQYHGTGGAELRALSAVDVALWDILGKVTGQPIHVLLGGACRDAVPIYNTCGSSGGIRDRDRFLDDPASLARELLGEGITRMKIWPFDELARETEGQSISSRALAEGVSKVAAIRDAVGDDMEVAVEGHCLWNLPAAIRIAHALEPYRPMWLEELLWPHSVEALAELRRSTTIPVIASERLMTRWQFADLLRAGGADIVMPDLAWTGGLSEGVKIARLASARELPVAPHNCGGPVTHVATLHYCAHVYNLFAMETIRAFYRGFFHDVLTFVPEPVDGRLPLPPGPGLGTDLRPEVLARDDLVRRVSVAGTGEVVGPATGDPWLTIRF